MLKKCRRFCFRVLCRFINTVVFPFFLFFFAVHFKINCRFQFEIRDTLARGVVPHRTTFRRLSEEEDTKKTPLIIIIMSIEDRIVVTGGGSSKSLAARFGLRDKTCVVTGGTRGLGKAMCDAFGEMGAKHVITCSRKGWSPQQKSDDDQKFGWTHENTGNACTCPQQVA